MKDTSAALPSADVALIEQGKRRSIGEEPGANPKDSLRAYFRPRG
jgi:hypothetical protein